MPKKNNPQPSMPNIGSDSGEEVEESVETPKEAKTGSKPKKDAKKNATKGKKMTEKVTKAADENNPTKTKMVEKTAKKTAASKKTIVIRLNDMKTVADTEKKQTEKSKPATKKKAAAKKMQNENETLIADQSDENVSAADVPKKQTLKEMMYDGIKFLTDRDNYSSLHGVEKYLKDMKDFDTSTNHTRIKATLHGFFEAKIIKQKNSKKNFSISVQFVMNEKKKTAADPIARRKSMKMAEKKKKQNDAMKNMPKKVAIIEHAPAKNAETNAESDVDDDSDTFSDDEDVPPVKRPVTRKNR